MFLRSANAALQCGEETDPHAGRQVDRREGRRLQRSCGGVVAMCRYSGTFGEQRHATQAGQEDGRRRGWAVKHGA